MTNNEVSTRALARLARRMGPEALLLAIVQAGPAEVLLPAISGAYAEVKLGAGHFISERLGLQATDTLLLSLDNTVSILRTETHVSRLVA